MGDSADPRLDRALALRALGEQERAAHGDAAAIAPYEEAIALMRDLDRPLVLAHTIRHLADILRHTGDLQRSRSCYDEALALYRAAPERSPLDFANALRGAALLQEQLGDFAAAADLWATARPLYAERGVAAGVEEADRRLARIVERRTSARRT